MHLTSARCASEDACVGARTCTFLRRILTKSYSSPITQYPTLRILQAALSFNVFALVAPYRSSGNYPTRAGSDGECQEKSEIWRVGHFMGWTPFHLPLPLTLLFLSLSFASPFIFQFSTASPGRAGLHDLFHELEIVEF